MRHTSRNTKKQSTTRPSTIIHYHHPSAVWISQSIGSLCAFLLIQSNVEGERESISDRRRAGKGSQCVAVSLGPVNFAHHHPRLPHLAYFSFPRPQNHTVSCAKCLCPIVHILYKPSDHQVSLRFCVSLHLFFVQQASLNPCMSSVSGLCSLSWAAIIYRPR